MTQGVHDITTGESIDASPMTETEVAEHLSRTKPLIEHLSAYVEAQQ